MKLIIKRIKLQNFKGIRDLQLELNEQLTKIYGCNGAGKSTLADAVSYCLFGKDAKGNTQFGIKTRDEEGNEIPHLDHSVQLDVLVNDEPHTFSRTLKEKWTKPRGTNEEIMSSNYVEYFVDGQMATKGDYEKFIYSIASDSIFRMLTNPQHFPNLHWQEQLNLLFMLAGDITNADVVGADPRYKSLLEQLERESYEAIKKHTSYQIREIKKQIDEMPVKMSTLKQTLPERLDWHSIESDKLTIVDERQKLVTTIAQLEAGSNDAHSQQIRERIRFTEKRIDDMQKSKRFLAREYSEKHEAELRNLSAQISDAEGLINSLTLKRSSLDKMIDVCNRSIKDFKAQMINGSDEWSQINKQRFEVPADATICPTCSQYLPEELARDAVDKARKEFNERKASRLKELQDKAVVIKQDIKQAENEKQEYISSMSLIDPQLQEASRTKNDFVSKYKTLKSEEPVTAEQLLEQDDNYQKVISELNVLQSQLSQGVVFQSDALDDMKSKVKELDEKTSVLNTQLASRTQYDKVSKLIEQTQQSWDKLNEQLTMLEQQEDVIRSFAEKRDNLIESRVNSNFQFTRYRLFKTQVDGTREPWCTASYNGVEYRDLNNARKIACGIDIINAFSKYYNVSVPITIDNAEACNEIPDTVGQKIELYVSSNKELTIL